MSDSENEDVIVNDDSDEDIPVIPKRNNGPTFTTKRTLKILPDHEDNDSVHLPDDDEDDDVDDDDEDDVLDDDILDDDGKKSSKTRTFF